MEQESYLTVAIFHEGDRETLPNLASFLEFK